MPNQVNACVCRFLFAHEHHIGRTDTFAPGLPGAKSTRMVSVRACALNSVPATYHVAPMPKAQSNSLSVKGSALL